MKNIIIAIMALTVLVGCKKEGEAESSSETATEANASLETLDQKASYLYGFNVASYVKNADITIDREAFLDGISDAESELEPKLSEDEMRATGMALQSAIRTKQQEQQKKLGDENSAAGQAFLAANLEKEGVVQTESGLQYKVLEAGTGTVSPTTEDRVVTHYKGTLIDGTEFDSSHKTGKPATFGVTQVIPGWVEVLQLMKVGDKWEVYIPADLAYGPGGQGGIPPNSTLIFEMELVEILPQEVMDTIKPQHQH